MAVQSTQIFQSDFQHQLLKIPIQIHKILSIKCNQLKQ